MERIWGSRGHAWASGPQDFTSPGLALAKARGAQAFGLCSGWSQSCSTSRVSHPQDSPSARVLKGGPMQHGPMPGWSHPEDGPVFQDGPTPGQAHDRVVPCPG